MNNKPTPIDELVSFSYAMREHYPLLLELAAYDQLTDGNVVWPYHVIMKITGQSEDACLEFCESAENRELIESGVSAKGGWLTAKGWEVFQGSGLKYNDFFDKAFENGIPHQIIEGWPEAKKSGLLEEINRLETNPQPEPTRTRINPEFAKPQDLAKDVKNTPGIGS